MPQFILVYKGEATDVADMSEEEGAAIMAAWAAWIERVGSALADIGTPFGPSTSLADDGRNSIATPLNGYSIVDAADMAGAEELAKGHPFLSEGAGNFAIDIYELMPV